MDNSMKRIFIDPSVVTARELTLLESNDEVGGALPLIVVAIVRCGGALGSRAITATAGAVAIIAS